MRPLTLHMENFGCFADETIDFSGLRLAAIVGDNGVGKTTILNAVRVALFGRSAGTLDGFIRKGAPRFKLSLTFVLDGEEYRVDREQAKAQKAALYHGKKPIAEGVSQVDAKVQELLGITFPSFVMAHHIPQGGLGAFANLLPSERKGWLASVLPLQLYDKLEANAKVELKDARTWQTKLETGISQYEGESVDADELTKTVNDCQHHLTDLEMRKDKGMKAREGVQREADERQGLAAKLGEAKAAHDEAAMQIVELNEELSETDAKRQDLERALDSLPTERPDTEASGKVVSDLRVTVADLESKQAALLAANDALTAARTRLQKASAEFTEAQLVSDKYNGQQGTKRCTTCGQLLGLKEEEKVERELTERVTKSETNLDEAKDAHEAAEQEYRKYQDVQDELPAAKRELADAISKHDELVQQALAFDQSREMRETLAGLDAEMEGMHKERERLEAEVEQHDAARAKLQAKHDEYAASVQQLQGIDAELKAISEELTYYADLKSKTMLLLDQEAERREKLTELRDRLAEQVKRITMYELLAKAYGRNGIQARIIDQAVYFIEDAANEFLSRFTSGLSISLNTQSENKTGGIRETLDILVSDDAGERSVETFSGGERTRIHFALSIGLSRLLSTLHGSSIDSFTVDEPEYLDRQGVEELVNCLNILAETTPLVVLVSHVPEMLEGMPQRIVVSKSGGVSKAAVA